MDTDALFQPHLDAIRASVREGFRFRHLRGADGEMVLQGFRVANGAMDVFLAYAPEDSVAARYRVEDLEEPEPPALWRRNGTVEAVVLELLALPAHGARGSPSVPESRTRADFLGALGRSDCRRFVRGSRAPLDSAASRSRCVNGIPRPRAGGTPLFRRG